MKLKNVLFLLSLTLFTSCSSFVDGMYRDLDRQERMSADAEEENSNAGYDQFDQYRKKRRTSSEYNRPGKNRNVSTNSQRLEELRANTIVQEKIVTFLLIAKG
jgi:hypothetical protein